MPQMAPINWLILFIIFSITIMIFNVKNYYCFLPMSIKSSQYLMPKQKTMIWKW